MTYLYKTFTEAATQAPHALACAGSFGSVTYGELHMASKVLRDQLASFGVRPGHRVAIAATLPPADLLAAVLAVSASGCSLVPVPDPDAEGDRLARLGVSNVVAFSGSGVEVRLAGSTCGAVAIPDECYVLATSGSTGKPKDAVITNANLGAFGRGLGTQNRVGAADRVAVTFPPYFDGWFHSFLLAVTGRATLVVPVGREHLAVSSFVARQKVTVWMSTPSHLMVAARVGALEPGSLPRVRLAFFGAEALTRDHVALWRAAAPISQVINMYGPTETAVAVSDYEMPDHAPLPPVLPMGHCYPHMEARLVPTAKANARSRGELCLRGPQRFSGYADPRDNAGRFYLDGSSLETLRIGSPTPSDWYRTGDLVEQTADGFLFMGRLNAERKVMGRRVDLALVRSVMCADPRVSDAWVDIVDESVVAVLERRPGAETTRPMDVTSLRRYARPRTVLWVDELPLLANGKRDHRQLIALMIQAHRTAHGIHPQVRLQ